MTYNPNIPQAPNLLSQSQADLLANFQVANTAFGINHTAFSLAPNQGKHKSMNIVAGVAPGTGAGEGGLYVFNSGAAREYLYYERESAGARIPFSMLGGFACVNSAGALTGTSFNITSARTNQGRYTLTFTRAMLDANYAVVVTLRTAPNLRRIMSISSKVAGSFNVECQNTDSGAVDFQDPDSFSVLVFGEIS